MNKKLLKQIPNIITLSRIILIIISSIMLFNKNYSMGIILLVIAALTDFFDGYFARKLDAMSMLGAKLDQLSDKLFSFLICLVLVKLGNNYLIITLLLEIIFSIVVSIQSFKLNEWRVSTKYGKVKITLLFITIIFGTIILKFKRLNIVFIIIWIITLIVQIYANTKIVIDVQKDIELKNNKLKKRNNGKKK